MIKNDRDRRECENTLARWRALKSALERMARSFSLEITDLTALIDDHIQSLSALVMQYESIRFNASVNQELDVFVLLRHADQLPKSLVEGRLMLGWTQTDLALQANFARQQICRYECNQYSTVGLGSVIRLAHTLTSAARERNLI